MRIEIKLKGSKSRDRWPLCKILLNNEILFSGEITDIQTLLFDVAKNETNKLEIVHHDKVQEDTIFDENYNVISDRSIELLGIKLDQYDMFINNLLDFPFYVQWPPSKIREFLRKGETPPTFIKKNLYFGYNGTYQFDFFGDSKREFFNQFWLDEVQSNEYQTKVKDNTEIFNRYGEEVDINVKMCLNIYDLEKLIN